MHLLNYHPESAFPFLLDFVERACETYVESGLDKNSIQKVNIRLVHGSEREVFASARLWCLYRGTQVGPSLLVSALMAIEDWLLRQAESAIDLAPYFRKVYERAVTVAPLAVLASVACAASDAVGETALPLLGTLLFYYLDLNRQLLESHCLSKTFEMIGGHRDPVKDIHQAFLKKSDEREHRKMHLEQLVLKLSFGPLQSRIAALIDSMKKDIAQLADNGMTDDSLIPYRMILKRIDLREHEAERVNGGYLIKPKIDEPDLRAATEHSQEGMERAGRIWRLCTWAISTFEGPLSDGATATAAFKDWRAALDEARNVEHAAEQESDDNRIDQRYLRVLASVAACVVRDHGTDLKPDEATWCLRQIFDAVEDNADSTEDTVRMGRFRIHGSRLAAAVLPLLLDICLPDEASRVRTAIATALTHAVEEVRSYAVEGVRAWLWERHRLFAEYCFDGMLSYAAKRREALNATRKRRNLDASFADISRELTRELRARLSAYDSAADHLDEQVEDIRIGDFLEQDLLAALTLIPSAETAPRCRRYFASVMDDIFAAEETENRRTPGEERERIRYEHRHGFSYLFSKYVILQDVQGEAADLLDLIVAGIGRAPEAAAALLQDILIAELNDNAGERFWYIWSRCADAAYSKAASVEFPNRMGYSEGRTLLRTILFAETGWKADVKRWDELEQHRDFVHEAFARVGNTPRGFAALLRLLSTVGAFLLPDAIVELDSARANCDPATLLEDESAKYDLELLLRDCVLSMGTELRTRDALRRAALRLMDLLVNQGSSLAFQLRELIIAGMSGS